RLDDLGQQLTALQTANSIAAKEAIEIANKSLGAVEGLLAKDGKDELAEIAAQLTAQIKAVEERLDREIADRLSSSIDPDIPKSKKKIKAEVVGLRNKQNEPWRTPQGGLRQRFRGPPPPQSTLPPPIPIEPLVLLTKGQAASASTFSA